MDLHLEEATPILRRTPHVVRALLTGIPDVWVTCDEGAATWSPYDVVGHLIHGERTDWIPRVEHLLRHGDAVAFAPFDREAMFTESKGRSLGELLDAFETLRTQNLDRLDRIGITEADFTRPGLHPALGSVTLGQLLSTWVVHDLGHVAQITRVMARQYAEAVGPWRAYLRVLGHDAG